MPEPLDPEEIFRASEDSTTRLLDKTQNSASEPSLSTTLHELENELSDAQARVNIAKQREAAKTVEEQQEVDKREFAAEVEAWLRRQS